MRFAVRTNAEDEDEEGKDDEEEEREDDAHSEVNSWSFLRNHAMLLA